MDRMVYFNELVGGGAPINIPRPEFVKEHKNLLKVLRTGTSSQRKKEAAKQESELANIMK